MEGGELQWRETNYMRHQHILLAIDLFGSDV